jgi:hypothetical protein
MLLNFHGTYASLLTSSGLLMCRLLLSAKKLQDRGCLRGPLSCRHKLPGAQQPAPLVRTAIIDIDWHLCKQQLSPGPQQPCSCGLALVHRWDHSFLALIEEQRLTAVPSSTQQYPCQLEQPCMSCMSAEAKPWGREPCRRLLLLSGLVIKFHPPIMWHLIHAVA